MSQYEALKKFKEKLLVNGVLKHFHEYDDLFLLKFLRARKFDVEQSYKMITDYFHWRLVENIAEIHNFMLPELRDIKKYYPHGHHKVDKLVTILVILL